ncbi:MAG: uracil-DNA glycosylase family protein [Myxococcota bacterium]
MSAKTEIYSIARDLRAYLEWQAKSGTSGAVPADAEQRAVFEAIEKRREDQKLAAARREIMGEDAPEASSEPVERPDAKHVEKEKPSDTAKSSTASDNAAENLRERFSAATREEKPTVETESDDSDDQPWKRFGSRPRPRFAGKKEKSEMADKSKPKTQERNQKNRDQEDESSGGSGQRGPQYDENTYPEASGVMMEGAVDVGDSGGGNAPPQAKQKPRRAQKQQETEKKSKDDMTKAEKLEFLEDYLGDCKRCDLCENRTNIVFGDGSAKARLVFVGEAPGYNEDKQGLPFVGDAGQLLNKMIEAMGLEREDVYICNVIKCRPPKNRDPRPDEIKECSPFLRKQLEVIDPEVIVSLGKFASQWLLESDDAMGAMRGTWHAWNDTPVMPTYHPAYLLRQENQKRKTWNDLQMVMERLGL